VHSGQTVVHCVRALRAHVEAPAFISEWTNQTQQLQIRNKPHVAQRFTIVALVQSNGCSAQLSKTTKKAHRRAWQALTQVGHVAGQVTKAVGPQVHAVCRPDNAGRAGPGRRDVAWPRCFLFFQICFFILVF
jgi:hypothetical protein